MGYLNVLAALSELFWLESGKNARIKIMHVCFIALTLAHSLEMNEYSA